MSMVTYIYGRGRYGRQFSAWNPPIWFVQDDFGSLIEVRP